MRIQLYTKGGVVKLQEIRELARRRGIEVGKMKKKIDIVRAIQKDEGNDECFMTERASVCDQTGCLWIEDCTK